MASVGQSDYFLFVLGSLFTHSSPGALFIGLADDPKTADWNKFRAELDQSGENGLRFFLGQASECFIDIIGLSGDSITGYDRQWFDEFALPLLKKFWAVGGHHSS